MKEYEATLRLFKGVLTKMQLSEEPSEKGLKHGIYISSSFSDDVIDEAIKQYGKSGEEANQTFHKSLAKVKNEDIEQLYFEQIIHYLTTYGAEALDVYDPSNVFIPKEKLEVPELEITDDISLIRILPITEECLRQRINDMITSNLALSKQTVWDIVSLSDYIDIDEYSEGDRYLCKITNKEVRTSLYGKFGILPKRGDEFLRYFLSKYCGKSLLIKDDMTIRSICVVNTDNVYDVLTRYEEQYDLINLSKVYRRFKPLFLAMKRHPKKELLRYYSDKDLKEEKMKCAKINNIINKISKLSNKYNEPMKDNDLNHFLKWIDSLECSDMTSFKNAIRDKLKNASPYTVVKLYNYMNCLYENVLGYNLYKIRNGKIYVENMAIEDKPYLNMATVETVKGLVSEYVVDMYGKTVYLPSDIDYKVMQSEKQFVGNIPFGSSISIEKQSLLVGIHWCNLAGDNEEERVDLDLHLKSNKYDIGWNASWRESSILFTGDNTTAPLPDGASEFIYIDNDVKDTSFSIELNNYTTSVGPIPYEIIIAKAPSKDNISNNRNYVVDPNDIITKIPMTMELGQSEQIIGVLNVKDDVMHLIFTDLTTSNRCVSNNKDFDKKVRDFIDLQEDTQLRLSYLLRTSGANILDTKTTTADVAYVMDEDMKLIPIDEADRKGVVYTGDDIYYRKEEVPVDYDFSLEALTKDSFIKLFKKQGDVNG